MDLALKRPWAGLLFFFWVGMVLSETGEPYGPQLKIHRKAIERIIQKSMTEGNILDEMSSMATKNKGGAQAIKGMKAMKVKEITPPEICTKLIPHNQMQTSVITSITVAGKSNVGGKMEITLKAKMNIMIKMSKHPTKHIGMEKMGCEVQVLAWTTNLPSRMIPKVVNKFLNTTLGKVMPGMMCPAADKVITFMETKVEAMFEKKSFGKNGTLWYEVVEEPAVFPDYNFIHLKARAAGYIIHHTPTFSPVSTNLG
ncbi:BPI fold-containing family B member 6-like [Candoia aspera]|uniref:BPI fold-containing family B member 6-like n=1 Tax=Candoia aspera TaxID=51853 RepID=UPI002FD7D04F